MGKKCPLKTVALAVDEKEKSVKSSQGRAQSWWRPSHSWEAKVECQWHGKVAWKRSQEQQQNEDQKWNDNQHHKVSKMSYAESEPDFSNFAINSLSTFAPIFSESASDASESNFSSVFMNLDICVSFTLYLHSSK